MTGPFNKRRGQYRPPPSCRPSQTGRADVYRLLSACKPEDKRCDGSASPLLLPPGGMITVTVDAFDARWGPDEQWTWEVTGTLGTWTGPTQVFNGQPNGGGYQCDFIQGTGTVHSVVHLPDWDCVHDYVFELQEEGGGGGGGGGDP